MKGFTYQRANRVRTAAAVMLAIMLALAGWKTYAALQTVRAYKQAEAHKAAGRLMEAEAQYLKASSVPGFDYRKEEISASLAELQPVVHTMRTVASLSASIAEAAASGSVAGLAKAHADYQEAKQQHAARGAADAERFAQAASEAHLETALADAFSAARKAAEKRLAGSKPADDTGSAASELILIPAAYYGGDAAKRKAVNALLQSRDTARLDALARTKPYKEVWKLGEELRISYERLGWEAAWIAPKLEKLALGSLSIVEKQDLGKFLDAAQQLKSYEAWAGPGSKIDAYVDSVIRNRLVKAAALADSGKYDEAIALYRTIGDYRDTSKELLAVEQRKLANDPQQLLQAAGAPGKLAAVTRLKGRDGSAQAAALSETGTRLFFAQLQADGSPGLLETELSPGVKPKSVRYSEPASPGGDKLLLIEGVSAQRKARYVLVQIGNTGLHPVLDVEADAIMSGQDGELTVARPLSAVTGASDAGALLRGYYRYEQDHYVLVRAESAEPDRAKNEPAQPEETKPDLGKPHPPEPDAGKPEGSGSETQPEIPKKPAENGTQKQ
ncbi:hypothetical protein [Paenibacillus sp. tmac-D7]|uniref:hypothetical protein n=1 Tax=Paenibacillus sp. tmac-D7 TaxID=2591462 RepID=UPI0011441FC8|nr:hypothetical protein [Paenibacillus sp. tmac-D7]